MRNSMSYHRSFIMMQEEDKGYGKNGKPTGYLKLEMKENKGKALVHIQNLGQVAANKVLKVYLLASTQPEAGPLPMGAINLKGDSGDATCEFSTDEVQGLGLEMSLLDTAVIMCKDTTTENGLETFPMVGFEKQSWNWKRVFLNKKIYQKEQKVQLQNKPMAKEAEINKINEEVDDTIDAVVDESAEKSYNTKLPVGFVWNSDQEENMDKDIYKDIDIDIDKGIDRGETTDKKLGKADAVEAGEEPDKLDKEVLKTAHTNSDWEAEQKYIQETMEAFERSFRADDGKNEKDKVSSSNSKKLAGQLSRYAAVEQPFINGDSGYKWMIINDCAFILNNIYSNYNITFSLYNPYVINLVRRYGYFLFGIKEEETENPKCIAYAVPARYATEPHPFLNVQAYAYWIPKSGERRTIGALGYWVICIDVNTGDFVPFDI